MKQSIVKSSLKEPFQVIKSLWPQEIRSSAVVRVKQYLRDTHYHRVNRDTRALFFTRHPSVAALALGLQCNTLEVYLALKELKQEGYSYRVKDDKSPIILWDTLRHA